MRKLLASFVLTLVLVASASAQDLVTVNTPQVAPGGLISFTITNGPGNATDWVTLAQLGEPNNTYVAWQYLSGSQSAPTVGLTGVTLGFTAPLTPGVYNIRFFANNALSNHLATSTTIFVGVEPPPSAEVPTFLPLYRVCFTETVCYTGSLTLVPQP